MRHYYQINADGYITASAHADVAPEPYPGCTVVESETTVDGDIFHSYLRFHWLRQQWEDVRSLVQLKLDKWQEIKAERTAREYGTFTASTGHIIDIDQASQIRIQSAYSLAVDARAANTPFSIEWTMTNDEAFTLNATQMIGLGKQVYQYINELHATARTLRNQIIAATTKPQVKAISWPV